MNIKLSKKEYRHLLDLVYIGNWVLNSARGLDRFEEYDKVQEKLFGFADQYDLPELSRLYFGHIFPSRAYEEGGIHNAISDYEDAVFFDILAEELSRRDMSAENLDPTDIKELTSRIDKYLAEFEVHGIDNLNIEK